MPFTAKQQPDSRICSRRRVVTISYLSFQFHIHIHCPVIPNHPVFNIQDHEVETFRSREARYHDLLEHRSNFLERRRRIRSQVRALQWLGSRFENFSGHERFCILSGQHRTGRCTCRINNRDSNSNDQTSVRASISRIVMLAEALLRFWMKFTSSPWFYLLELLYLQLDLFLHLMKLWNRFLSKHTTCHTNLQ